MFPPSPADAARKLPARLDEPGRASFALRLGEEACFLHEVVMALLFARDPVAELLARKGFLRERALLHEVVPLGQLTDLLHQRDPVVDLVLADPARHEDTA